MRAAVVLTLLAGCRISFDALPAGDGDGGTGGSGATGDGSDAMSITPGTCAATAIAGLDLATPQVIEITAAATGTGYALGFLRQGTSSRFFGTTLSTALVPSTAALVQTSPAGAMPTYIDATLSFINGELVGMLREPNQNVWIKTFRADMSGYDTLEMRNPGIIGEPSVALATNANVAVWFDAQTIRYTALDAAGVPTGGDQTPGGAGSTIVTASVAGDAHTSIVSALQNGTCFLHNINGPAMTNIGAFANPCTRPHAVANGSEVVYVYEAGDTVTTRVGTAFAQSSIGAARPLGAATGPRAFRAAGRYLVVALSGSSLVLFDHATGTDVPVPGLPAGIPDAYTTAGDRVFAVYGTELHAITCP